MDAEDFIATIVFLALSLLVIFGIIWVIENAVTGQGADGQDCYDNLTCDKGAVCYKLGDDEFECRGQFPVAR